MKIYAMDGTVCVEVTEAVQALFDVAMSSHDYGSGFWSYEDAAPVLKLARIMGWQETEELQRYCDDKLFVKEQMAWLLDNGLQGMDCLEGITGERRMVFGQLTEVFSWAPKPHEHVYSTTGRCMWWKCEAREQAGGR